ncbi:hypothetical protein [Paracholeplasma manati]|uniref:hypothetical protein n=1 Tax=Paracholeplasma manati TaxID=591373 RepID=UPI002407C599|nr:hypothetical protein [Paracholeplasma manati]MDG0889650.1 hypothetical protein [Paracholeplasma manati]
MKPNALRLFKALYEAKKPLKIEGTSLIFKDVSAEYMTLFLSPIVDMSVLPEIELDMKNDVSRLKTLYKMIETIVKNDLFRVGIIGDSLNQEAIDKYQPYEDDLIKNKRYKNELYFSLKRDDLERFMDDYQSISNDVIILTPGNHAFLIPEKFNDSQKDVILSLKTLYESSFKLPEPMDYLGLNLLTTMINSFDYLASEYDIVRAIHNYRIEDSEIINHLLENHNKPFVLSMIKNMNQCQSLHKAQHLIRQAKKRFIEEPWEILMELPE